MKNIKKSKKRSLIILVLSFCVFIQSVEYSKLLAIPCLVSDDDGLNGSTQNATVITATVGGGISTSYEVRLNDATGLVLDSGATPARSIDLAPYQGTTITLYLGRILQTCGLTVVVTVNPTGAALKRLKNCGEEDCDASDYKDYREVAGIAVTFKEGIYQQNTDSSTNPTYSDPSNPSLYF